MRIPKTINFFAIIMLVVIGYQLSVIRIHGGKVQILKGACL